MNSMRGRLVAVGRVLGMALLLTLVLFAGGLAVTASAAKLPTITTIANEGEAGADTVVGETYVVKWNVNKGSGTATPTGNVSVSGDGPTCLKQVGDIDGCTLRSTSVGTKSIVVRYLGDSTYAASTATALDHDVKKADTTALITNATQLSTASSQVRSPFTVEWSVTADAPSIGGPTGFVQVFVDDRFGCAASVATGKCAVTPGTAGQKSIVVKYLGNKDFATSSSDATTHVVTDDKVETTLEITNTDDLADSTAPGKTYRVEWQVTVDNTSNLTPTGLVKVTVDDAFGCIAPVGAAGANGCILRSSTTGTKEIVVTYNGNAQLASSSDSAEHEVVEKTATQTTIETDLREPTAKGDTITIEWAVTGSPTGGDVTVTMGEFSCHADVADGECDITPTKAGFFVVKATYEGDATHQGSASKVMVHRVTN